jgi:ribosomal protein L15
MGAVIDLESLKTKELILPTATTLKVYTSGPISKTFTVEANHFTLDAIQAITDADGDSVMVR